MADIDPIIRLNAALEGRYHIERKLGEGGMATVYLAEDLRHHRHVALKVLKPQLAAVMGAERFLAEIETTANLQHPHILPLFDSGEADGFLFYVMPYVEGESLRERLDREHQLQIDATFAISPDSREIAFPEYSQDGGDRAIRVVPVEGGIPRELGVGGALVSAWGADDKIYYQWGSVRADRRPPAPGRC
ncbi:MAG: protein kinase [Gemmatimonadota bacterium]